MSVLRLSQAAHRCPRRRRKIAWGAWQGPFDSPTPVGLSRPRAKTLRGAVVRHTSAAKTARSAATFGYRREISSRRRDGGLGSGVALAITMHVSSSHETQDLRSSVDAIMSSATMQRCFHAVWSVAVIAASVFIAFCAVSIYRTYW